ncbi:XRE family transcriptional regulator [Burkholderia gladioli]|uniref:XRE family transcriptional regulator n=1 Tax=Burkholderia gladioli TaxID=28095 RepID=UPI00164150AC|nr:XRE family transcriptional regulator [Burkholderia gladioli]
MKTNDEIRRANLTVAIKRFGTAKKLAEAADVSVAYLSQVKNGQPESRTGKPKNMGDEVARKIEAALGEPAGWMDADHSSVSRISIDTGEIGSQKASLSDTFSPSLLHYPVSSKNFRNVFVIGRAQGGLPERIWTDGGYPVGIADEYAEIATADPHAFLVPVVGGSMAPRFNPGEFALIEPATEPDIEDDVLVRLASGVTILKRLLSRRGGMIRLGSYAEAETHTFAPEEISWMYYVAHPVPPRKIKIRM